MRYVTHISGCKVKEFIDLSKISQLIVGWAIRYSDIQSNPLRTAKQDWLSTMDLENFDSF